MAQFIKSWGGHPDTKRFSVPNTRRLLPQDRGQEYLCLLTAHGFSGGRRRSVTLLGPHNCKEADS